MSLLLRAATKDDLEFLLSLVPRLSEFGLPPSRDAKALEAFTENKLRQSCGETTSVVVIAEQDGRRLGFIQVGEDKEVFSGEAHASVVNLVVVKEVEGKGVGKALMNAAETWAREKGFQFISLYVFGTNQHARVFYKKLGYGEDSLKLTKTLREA
jgi:GNAT superfamily N-acetyltransferase